MPNMSYCEFENTYNDLLDCLSSLRREGGIERLEEISNDYEKQYVKKLVSLCAKIVYEFDNDNIIIPREQDEN